MGRYCQICGRHRPNECFGGRGERRFTCKKCLQRPRKERAAILKREAAIREWEDVYEMLFQSNISKGNIERLRSLAGREDSETQRLAALVLEVGMVRPHKRRRVKFLRKERPDLLRRLVGIGAVDPWEWGEDLDLMFEEMLDGVCDEMNDARFGETVDLTWQDPEDENSYWPDLEWWEGE